jgi:hypothetical protein
MAMHRSQRAESVSACAAKGSRLAGHSDQLTERETRSGWVLAKFVTKCGTSQAGRNAGQVLVSDLT